MAIATMDKVLRAVLATGNKEQNQAYPPGIFSVHFNQVTAFLLDEIVRQYPVSQAVVDIGRSFLRTELISNREGVIKLPENYRNFLSAGIYVTADYQNNCTPGVVQTGNADCENEENCLYPDDPLGPSPMQVVAKQAQGRCVSNPLTMVDIDEWDYRTNHKYKFPTLKKPIGMMVDAGTIKVCPYGVSSVEVRYMRQPKDYFYGYVMNPDDTYSFNPATTVESEWTDNAMQFLIKGVSTLYGAYVRDQQLKDFNVELRRIGMF